MSLKTLKHNSWLLALVGAVALLVVAPESTAPGRAAACMPETAAADDAPGETEELDPVQAVLVDYLSRRYSIAAQATEQMVRAAFRAARQAQLDPLLILAVISVESRFNPIAESGLGAKGLMQIIPRYHRAKLLERGGEDAVLDPESNIIVGTRILQEYVYRAGTLEAGLQSYNGAASDESARYARRVLAERGRLQRALRAATPMRAGGVANGMGGA